MAKTETATRLIERLAKQEGVPSGTVRQWRYRGWVPHHWRIRLMAAAGEAGTSIPVKAFDRFRAA